MRWIIIANHRKTKKISKGAKKSEAKLSNKPALKVDVIGVLEDGKLKIFFRKKNKKRLARRMGLKEKKEMKAEEHKIKKKIARLENLELNSKSAAI